MMIIQNDYKAMMTIKMIKMIKMIKNDYKFMMII